MKEIKPILRWVGGKLWLAPLIKEISNKIEWGTYIEPFLGSGATYSHLAPKSAVLNDINPSLINFYQILRDTPEGLFRKITSLPISEQNYYKTRASKPRTALTAAARFVYLNRLCFGGVYRENKNGRFNVPFGHKKTFSNSLNIENFRSWSSLLHGAAISNQDFEASLQCAETGSLIYADPVFTDVESQRFDRYNASKFTFLCHNRLADVCNNLASSGRSSSIVSLPYDERYLKIYRKGLWIAVRRSRKFGIRSKTEYKELLWIKTACGFDRSFFRSRRHSMSSYEIVGTKRGVLYPSDLRKWDQNQHAYD
jgi:DNA adenine methylase